MNDTNDNSKIKQLDVRYYVTFHHVSHMQLLLLERNTIHEPNCKYTLRCVESASPHAINANNRTIHS